MRQLLKYLSNLKRGKIIMMYTELMSLDGTTGKVVGFLNLKVILTFLLALSRWLYI